MDEVQAFIARNKHQFGYIMGEAARQWAAIDPVGALTVGPCVKQVEVYGEYFKLADDNERHHGLIIGVRDNLWTWAMNLNSHRLTKEEYKKLKEILQPLFDEAKALEEKKAI